MEKGINFKKFRYNKLYKQYLVTQSAPNIFDVIYNLLGLHSTDYWTPYLSLFSRIGDYDPKTIFEAINTGKGLARINAFRSTNFVVHSDNLALILKALEGNYIRRTQNDSYIKTLGPEKIEEGVEQLCSLLETEGPLKTTEINKHLPSLKSIFRPVLFLAMARGLVIRASASHARSNLTSYALFKQWMPLVNLKQYSETEAIQNLTKKYISIFGPVTVEDIAWCFNFTKTLVRETIENISSDLEVFNIGEEQSIMTKQDYNRIFDLDEDYNPEIFLLPYEDHFPKAYISRSWYLSEEMKIRLFPRNRRFYWPSDPVPEDPKVKGMNVSGELRPSIWLGHEIIGRWELEGTKDNYDIVWSLYRELKKDQLTELKGKIQDLEIFINERLLPIS